MQVKSVFTSGQSAESMHVAMPRFPNTSIWITEFNEKGQSLRATQRFFNTSIEYLERLPYVERYALFGAFRSDVSNIGPNAAMLSSGGQLTDIGMWYLGRDQPGVAPNQGQARKVQAMMSQAAFEKGRAFLALLCTIVLLLVIDLGLVWLEW